MDVIASVAIFRGGLTLGRGDQRVGEAVNLRAVIIEVVFARHCCAASSQHPAEGIADSSPTRTTQVDRPGGVSGDELQVDLLTSQFFACAEVIPRFQDVCHDLALCRCGQADVEESGTGHGSFLDGILLTERLGQPGSQLARVRPGSLGHLHGDVGGVIAVLRVTGALNGSRFFNDATIQSLRFEHVLCHVGNQ